MPTLAVVGAGPKGIAIATKARALEAAGLGAPRVVLIDRGALAGNWSEAHRREFLVRTDRGVFSRQAEAILNQSRGFRALPGTAVAVQAGERQVVVTIEYGDEREHVAYDLVVVAIGFQARWFEALLGEQARHRLAEALAGDEPERRIEVDLSVAGLSPPLHLPVVAGLAQGPGFPNLSCLGLLSDRVLRRYVAPGEPALLAPERRERV